MNKNNKLFILFNKSAKFPLSGAFDNIKHIVPF